VRIERSSGEKMVDGEIAHDNSRIKAKKSDRLATRGLVRVDNRCRRWPWFKEEETFPPINSDGGIRDDIAYGGEVKREKHNGIENGHIYKLLM
jgi:hypothetical protein